MVSYLLSGSSPLSTIFLPVAGKCVTIQGTVVRVSNIKPVVTTMAFKCPICQTVQTISLPDGKYTPPNKVSSNVKINVQVMTSSPFH